MKDVLLSMAGKVTSLASIEVGINTSNHHSSQDIVFIGTFVNTDALAAFEKDSFHLSVGEFVGALKKDRVVIEYEI